MTATEKDFDETVNTVINTIPLNVEAMREAVDVAMCYGDVDGAHHKMWVIDQMVRRLAGDRYEELITAFCNGADGPETYGWDIGIAP